MPKFICGGSGNVETPFRIINFASNLKDVLVEQGSTINSITFNWSYNKEISSQNINPLVGVLPSDSRTTTLNDVVATGDMTFTLTADDVSAKERVRITKIEVVLPIFLGNGSKNPTPTQDEILTNTKYLTEPVLNMEFTVPTGDGYVYICVPSSFGDINSIIEKTSAGDFELIQDFTKNEIQFSLQNGELVNYQVWVFNYETSYSDPQLMEFFI